MRFAHGLRLSEVDGGVLVEQGDRAYMARRWRLSDATDALTKDASAYRVAVIHGKYRSQIEAAGIPFTFEARNLKSGHMEVKRDDMAGVLRHMAGFDHSVHNLGRSGASEIGFSTEYDIQRSLLVNWERTALAAFGQVYADEYPLDGGLNSRRIDILARDAVSGRWTVVAIKRAAAHPDAVHQVVGYRNTLSASDAFKTGPIGSVLVAERVPEAVRDLARANDVQAFEITFPFQMERCA